MPKEIKDMTTLELLEEFESSVVRAEKYIYSGFHGKGNEARMRARDLKEVLRERLSSLENDALNKKAKRLTRKTDL